MNPLRVPSRWAGVVVTFAFLFTIGALADEAAEPPRRMTDQPFLESELIFPAEHWHNHGSCIVETPQGDLLACWFHGSGERQADDVKIEGARLRRGTRQWSPRFTLADTPGYPDTNPCLLIDPHRRLWLFWPTILANRWESALMKYRVSSDYRRDGPPRWESAEILHITPGPEFEAEVTKYLPGLEAMARTAPLTAEQRSEAEEFLDAMRRHSTDKLYRRLGWMTRAHPFVFEGRRLIVPLYHDGFSFSLMALTDNWGATWRCTAPLIGAGNIQPSIVQRADGTLYTLMRDNGPPPHRLAQSDSRDGGETWSPVTDSALLNPGSGAEIIALRNGRWVTIGNDTEDGRHRLAVQISDDEGRTWRWKRALEFDPPGPGAGSYSYPSILEARDGSLHATYSFHVSRPASGTAPADRPAGKSIKHARFNEAWVRLGDRRD